MSHRQTLSSTVRRRTESLPSSSPKSNQDGISRQRQLCISNFFLKTKSADSISKKRTRVTANNNNDKHSNADKSSKDKIDSKRIKYTTDYSTQLVIDLGQKNFSQRKACPLCNMVLDYSIDVERKEHDKACKEYQVGVSFAIKSARVVANFSKLETIVEIRPTDASILRAKAQQVQGIAEEELGFCNGQEETTNNNTREHNFYLYVKNKRIVGMLVVESIAHAYPLVHDQERSTQPVKAMLGVHQIWVHQKHRKQSIATRLLDAARERFLYGTVIPRYQVAVSSPTQAGLAWAKHYCQTNTTQKPLLVYDCQIR